MQAIRGEGRTLVSILTLLVVIVALFALFAVAVYFATTLVPLAGTNLQVVNAVITAVGLALGLISVWVMGRVIERAGRPILGVARASILKKVLTYTLYSAVIVAALSRYTDISGYLVSLGIAAVVIGLAAQTVIGNLLAGIIVFAGRPFRVGDYIRVSLVTSPVEGRVIEIDFLRCKVETNDDIVVSVPNSLLINNPIANYTTREERPLRVAVALEREEDEERFREVTTSKLPAMLEGKPTIKVYVIGYEAGGFNVEVWVNVRTSRFLGERSAIIQALRKLSEKSKIPVKRISSVS